MQREGRLKSDWVPRLASAVWDLGSQSCMVRSGTERERKRERK